MKLDLLDPATAAEIESPDPGAADVFVRGMCRNGSTHYVSNISTRMMLLRHAGAVLPVTINDAEYENSYVCSPYTMARYIKAELASIQNAALRRALAGQLDAVRAIIRVARLDKIVQVNNWLLSINPYPPDWTPDIPAITGALIAQFPDHFISFPTLNEWSDAKLLNALKTAGYSIAAVRPIYVFDRFSETYFPRPNVKLDHGLLRSTPYRVVQTHELDGSDFERIAELYDMLYIRKHSPYNPAYTVEFFKLAHRANLIRFLGLRNTKGTIDGFVGLIAERYPAPVLGVLGYDTSVDRKAGLYRMLIALIFEVAQSEGRNINLSAGSASFKKHRGGQPVIEYRATYGRHLSRARRLALELLAYGSNTFGAPLMKRFDQ